MKIQTVTQADELKATARLAREIWTEHYTPLIGEAQVSYMLERFQSEQAIRHSIESGELVYYLAYHDVLETPVGYAAARWEEDAKRIHLSKLYVLRNARGAGAGRTLLRTVTDAYPEAASLYLTVNKGNAGAIAAYRSMGFQTVRSLVTDIGGGFVMDDYMMELDLHKKGSEQMSENKTVNQEHVRDPEENKRKKWADFVESVVVDFFSDNKLEKLSLEDGNGNKAKLGRTKDNEIKLEYSTTKLL